MKRSSEGGETIGAVAGLEIDGAADVEAAAPWGPAAMPTTRAASRAAMVAMRFMGTLRSARPVKSHRDRLHSGDLRRRVGLRRPNVTGPEPTVARDIRPVVRGSQ